MRVLGRPADLSQPRSALASGIGFVPDDRKRAALLPTRSVAENFSVAWTGQLTRAGVLDTRAERRRVRAAIERYNVDGRVAADPHHRALGRQPAEGRPRARPRPRPRGARALGADARHRRRREERDLPADAGARGAGRRDHHHLVRAPGAARDRRSHPRLLPRRGAGRVRRRRVWRRRRSPTWRSPARPRGVRLDAALLRRLAGAATPASSSRWSWSASTSRSPRTCS